MLLCGREWGENCAGRNGLWRNWRSARCRALRPCFKRAKTEQHSCARRSTARLSGENAHPRHGNGRRAAAKGAMAIPPLRKKALRNDSADGGGYLDSEDLSGAGVAVEVSARGIPMVVEMTCLNRSVGSRQSPDQHGHRAPANVLSWDS